MTTPWLKIALCGSVALNIFAVAAGTALWISREQVSERLSEARQPIRREPLRVLVSQMEPEVAEQVMTSMRARAIEARPDYEAARSARREAIRLAEGNEFNPVEVAALLEQSRASEIRGRAHLEVSAVEVLAKLKPEDRKALAPILSRHGPRGGHGHGGGRKAEDPAQAAPLVSQATKGG